MKLRSALGRARGLGSAKAGIRHWWNQRLTAIGLVPLSLWFVASLVGLADADHAAFTAWMGKPGNAAPMLLMALVLVQHAYLGLHVVIEDYVHSELPKFAALILVTMGAAFMAAFMAFSILKVALGG